MIEMLAAIFLIIIVIFLLAVFVAFSPTLIITEIGVLLKSRTPLKHAIFLICGISLSIFILVFASIYFIEPSSKIDFSKDYSFELGNLFDLILGIFLIVFGVIKLKDIDKPKVPAKKRFTTEKILTSKKLFMFGFFKMATSVSSLLAILLAGRFINSFLEQSYMKSIAGLLLFALSLSPFIAIGLVRFLRPDIFDKLNIKFKKAPFARWKNLIFVSCIVIGFLLTLYTLLHLR